MGTTSFRPARTTPKFNLPVPADEDPADFVTDIGNLADAIDLIVSQAIHKPGDLISSFASTRDDALLCDGSLVTNGALLYPALAAACPLLVSGNNLRLPDLRGCAIIGAGTGVGAAGQALTNRVVGGKYGSESTTLPTHAHSVYFESAGESGAGHQHYTAVAGGTGGMDSNNPHSHGVSDPWHSHQTSNISAGSDTLQLWGGVGNNWKAPGIGNLAGGAQPSPTGIWINGVDINHGHAVSAAGWSGNFAQGQMGNHSHTINGTTYNNGSDASGANLQPSVAANIFIKT